MIDLGQQIGQSAAFLYTFAELLFPKQANTMPLEFKTRSNDTRLNYLTKKVLKLGGRENSVEVFHLCSALIFQINALDALLDSKTISRRLWIKLIVVSLYHGCNSIYSLLNYFHTPSSGAVIDSKQETALLNVYPRETRKRIKKMKGIRNALVHYDFEKLNLKGLREDEHADYILIKAVEQTLGFEMYEFEEFLSKTAANASAQLSGTLGFPNFNPLKEPS